MKKVITLLGRRVEYELEKKSVKRISIAIRPDLSVRVSAPKRVTVEEIERFMKQSENRIVSSLDRFEGYIKKAGNAESGIRYLGKALCTVSVKGRGAPRLEGDTLTVRLSDPHDTSRIKAEVEKWLDEEAERVISDAFCSIVAVFGDSIRPPHLTLRRMVSRWGSCNAATARISLNKHLIKLPPECIDYVIYHELVHMLVPNHSKKFYEMLKSYLPDYKERERVLSENSFVLRK